MANPWNAVSLKEDPELLGIMSEELSRLQIEDDFVWVDVPEVQQVKDMLAPTSSDSVSSVSTSKHVSSIAPTVVKIVQFQVSDKNGSEVTEILYDDEYTDINESDEELDKLDEWEFKISNERSGMLKCTYPTPQWLKRKEHGTTRLNGRDKKPNSKVVNPLLPKIKFDASTTAVLERLIENRYLGQYNELVGRGKNSFVFHANCHRRNCMTMPVNNAVKVYKLSGDEEKNKLVFKRVQREFEHQCIVRKCKDTRMHLSPIRAWENVIVMGFIGFEKTISPSIQDISLHDDSDTSIYLEIVNFIHKLYNVLHLVHGKLCAKNIRCWFNHPQFIGWGHSVKTDHPQALTKLIKDCHFVTKFYEQRGVKVKTTVDLFKDITQCTEISSKLLEVINIRDLYDRYDQNPNRRSSSPEKPNRNLRFK